MKRDRKKERVANALLAAAMSVFIILFGWASCQNLNGQNMPPQVQPQDGFGNEGEFWDWIEDKIINDSGVTFFYNPRIKGFIYQEQTRTKDYVVILYAVRYKDGKPHEIGTFYTQYFALLPDAIMAAKAELKSAEWTNHCQ